jgi:hypothetical protein
MPSSRRLLSFVTPRLAAITVLLAGTVCCIRVKEKGEVLLPMSEVGGAAEPVVARCRTGDVSLLPVEREIQRIDEKVRSGASGMGLATALRSLLVHRCLRIAELELGFFLPEVEESQLREWWFRGGESWLRSYVDSKQLHDGVVVLPPDLRRVFNYNGNVLHEECAASDEACKTESVHFQEVAMDGLARPIFAEVLDAGELESENRDYESWYSGQLSRYKQLLFPFGYPAPPKTGQLWLKERYDANERYSARLWKIDLDQDLVEVWIVRKLGNEFSFRRLNRGKPLDSARSRQLLWWFRYHPYLFWGRRYERKVAVPGEVEVRRRTRAGEVLGVGTSDHFSIPWVHVSTEGVEATRFPVHSAVAEQFTYTWMLLSKVLAELEPDDSVAVAQPELLRCWNSYLDAIENGQQSHMSTSCPG